MKSLIKQLVEATAPTGYEGPIRDIIRAEVEPLADQVHIDTMGNLIARRGMGSEGTTAKTRIMLSAHMDEIGLIASHIDDNGFVRFHALGGVNPMTCVGGRVRFLNGSQGVIGIERLDNPSRQLSLERLFIDLGVQDRKQCPVKVGDVAVFDRPFLDLGERLVSKAMDDRIGVAVLIETMRQFADNNITSPHQLFFVFSTQEEVGLRGATTAAYAIEPDLGIAVDVTRSGDTPRGVTMDISLGRGPAIKVRDSGMLADPRVVRWMADSAERGGIPFQYEVLEAGTTDAKAIQLTRSGVLSGCLSIPTRYIHSPSEMVDYADVQNAIRLCVKILSQDIDLREHEIHQRNQEG